MSDFETRLKKGQELHDYLISFLQDNGIEYILSGYEHLDASKGARNQITRMSDETSQFVRHYPDVTVILPQKSYLIEVKNSSGIERDCYIRYMKLVEDMHLVVLLFLKNRRLCRVQDLAFSRVSSFDTVAEIEVPVDEGVWKTPRALPTQEYYQYLEAYKRKGKYTSGCSFAFIDFKATPCHNVNSLLKRKQQQEDANAMV